MGLSAAPWCGSDELGLAELPRLIAGTSDLGSPWPASRRTERASFRRLDASLDLGLSAFDLAASYAAGGAERLFGRWLAARGGRANLFVITKGGHPNPVARQRLKASALRSDLTGSLRRLKTEYVDLYLLHRDDGKTRLSDIIESMLQFRREGKILRWGVSNWTHARLEMLRRLSVEAGFGLSASSPHLSAFSWAKVPWPGTVSLVDDPAALVYHLEQRIPVLGWSPLGGGFLFSARRDHTYDHPENRVRRDAIRQIAAERGTSPASVALALLFHTRLDVRPIVSTSSPDHMVANLASLDLELTPRELDPFRSALAPALPATSRDPASVGGVA